MGNIFARRRPNTLEVLEQLDADLLNAEEYRKTTQIGQKRYVAYLIIFSSVTYLFAFVVGYFYYYPLTVKDTLIRLIPLFLFPFLVFGLKSLGCWWFSLRLDANDQQMEQLKRKRRDLLDQVKSKEVYSVAKEILEKFDPTAQLERLRNENKVEEERLREMEVRQRHVRSRQVVNTAMSNGTDDASSTSAQSEKSFVVMNGNDKYLPIPRQLPRPVPPAERSTLDKLVDYFLADGPSNRYALICKSCFCHNGMALVEDFQKITYRCVYCGTFNDRRKLSPENGQKRIDANGSTSSLSTLATKSPNQKTGITTKTS